MLLSCKANDNNLENNILGTWDVYASEINNKPNGFMKDAWFSFTKDNKVQSNLFGEDEFKNFVIKGGKLLIDTEDSFEMDISRLSNDTLHLEGKLKVYYMKYFLVKRKNEI